MVIQREHQIRLVAPQQAEHFFRVRGDDLHGNSYDVYKDTNDERFLLAPLVVGGLAGTALGFGIANNNQLNNRPPCCGWQMMPMPYYPQQYPTFSNTNSFYY